MTTATFVSTVVRNVATGRIGMISGAEGSPPLVVTATRAS
jgi:hypothetical protein